MKAYKKPFISLILLCALLLCACGHTAPEQPRVPRKVRETAATKPDESQTLFTFQKEDSFDNLPGSSKIYDLTAGYEDYGNQCALVYGKLRTLFGEPLYETEDNENLYAYCICAISEDGDVIYLEAYSGPTGPAIGGGQSEDALLAAEALSDYIWQAQPSDYSCTSYYADAPSIIEMGVQNGKPYYRETLDVKESWEHLYDPNS